jgi:hypothetical protein
MEGPLTARQRVIAANRWLKVLVACALLFGLGGCEGALPASTPAEAAAQGPCTSNRVQGDRALVIGIGGYQHGENLRLVGPAQDRERIRELLLDDLGYRPEEVCVLADGKATAAGIEKAFRQWLIEGTRPGSRAFFYFSGHGVRLSGGGTDLFDERFDDALAAHDYEPRSNRGTIRDDDLGRWFSALSGRTVTAVVDSCHSGTIYRSASQPLAGTLARTPSLRARNEPIPARTRSGAAPTNPIIAPRPGLVVWTAAAEYEVAFDAPIDKPKYGHFTDAWIRAIRQGPNTTVTEVLSSVRQEARKYCEQLRRERSACTSLTPQLFAIEPVYHQPILASLRVRPSDLGADEADWHRNIAAVLEATQQLASAPAACGQTRSARDLAPRPDDGSPSGPAGSCITATLLDAYHSPASSFVPDSPAILEVRSRFEGYLTVFTLDERDRLRRIFPADPDRPEDSKVESKRNNSFPGFEIYGPAGAHQLVVLVTQKPLDIRSSLTRGGVKWGTEPPRRPEQPQDDSEGTMPAGESIGGLLSQLLAGEGSNGGDIGDSAYTVVGYRVEDPKDR